jgi:hypothetical protein
MREQRERGRGRKREENQEGGRESKKEGGHGATTAAGIATERET